MVFDSKLFFLARATSVGSANAAVALSVSPGVLATTLTTTLTLTFTPTLSHTHTQSLSHSHSQAALAWEDTSLRVGSPPEASYSRVVEIAPGKFLVVSSDMAEQNSTAWIFSLVASYSLALAPFLPSNAAAGEIFKPGTLTLTPQPLPLNPRT